MGRQISCVVERTGGAGGGRGGRGAGGNQPRGGAAATTVSPVDGGAGTPDANAAAIQETATGGVEQKTKGEALLKAKFEAHETRQRAQLAEMQPIVAEYIKEGLDMAGEHMHELESLTDFGNNLAKVDNVESAMPLARLITCHSARFKRKTEEFSVTKDAAEALAKASSSME